MEHNKTQHQVDRILDLKCVVCPYTFIKAKLALEEIMPGQILEVIVDHMPAAENVPSSMENEGHEILGVEQINATDWSITVRKKQE